MILSASEEAMATDGVRLGLTVVVIVVDVEVADFTQDSDLVITSFTSSPLASAALE